MRILSISTHAEQYISGLALNRAIQDALGFKCNCGVDWARATLQYDDQGRRGLGSSIWIVVGL